MLLNVKIVFLSDFFLVVVLCSNFALRFLFSILLTKGFTHFLTQDHARMPLNKYEVELIKNSFGDFVLYKLYFCCLNEFTNLGKIWHESFYLLAVY